MEYKFLSPNFLKGVGVDGVSGAFSTDTLTKIKI